MWNRVILETAAEVNEHPRGNWLEGFPRDAESSLSLPHHVSGENGKRADLDGVQCVKFSARTHRVSGEMGELVRVGWRFCVGFCIIKREARLSIVRELRRNHEESDR